MATKKVSRAMVSQDKWRYGHLHLIDSIPAGDEEVANAIGTYANYVDEQRQSRHWVRAVQWIENILFSSGRQYVDDILVSRLTRDSNNDLSIVNEATRSIPRPVNDLLARYTETNIALLTENRPRPRVTPKGNRAEDEDRAELSEWVLEYLWEALDMPELHREIARLMLHCGVCWLEVVHDPTQPRRIATPETQTQANALFPAPGGGTFQAPVPRQVPVRNDRGELQFTQDIEFGDITAKVISPFEMHLPVSHWWNGDDMDWVMREYYTPVSSLKDKYSDDRKANLNKRNGWHTDRIDKIGTVNVRNLPIWWWERLSDLVEGPGPSIYVGTPEQWEGYTVVRIFDRKPSPQWPRGRTIIVAGNQVIYDSPKKIGARAYDPRWPTRWHPYTRYRWEAMLGSIYGRSLVSKLLPSLKRINAIDTTLIMWRRTVPFAAWIAPKGAHPVEDLWKGGAGQVYEYDPRLTAGAAPQPVNPPPYPATALEERQMMLAQMEAIAGTEEILRGQRPAGVTSAVMLDVLRKQALASRSAILQSWDESLQVTGSNMLQEVIKNVREDPRYIENLKIISRERQSQRTIESFAGVDISDNVNVMVDTASMALVSKEAREQKVLEMLQYLPNLEAVDPVLATAIIEELGLKDKLQPNSADVTRAKRMLALIRQGDFQRVIPLPEDDPYVFADLLIQEMKSDAFYNLDQVQQQILLALIDIYKEAIKQREEQQMRMQQAMMSAEQQAKGKPQ